MSTVREAAAARTRATLIEVGTALFAKKGFAEVTTAQVCEAAGVTRGALYHHFGSMVGLMEACFAAVDHGVVDTLSAHTVTGTSAERLRAVSHAFVDQLADETIRQILFVEAPAALGWARWREIDGGRSLGLVKSLLVAAHDEGDLLPRHNPKVLAHLLLGGLNELAMFVAASRSREKALADAHTELSAVLDGIFTQPV
ncbi:TetR/AcrR family transcriptional regulator [Nocardia camponoti]|uniref:Transcriptional regulator, TetR family protein n=1 Tax=Nocardia camponoti TaxID=1616106 RepID=A0A917Q9N1_9NOCA|nr:TetR/AcrR family transcriptional regulator [Nocardia camponoti]GGK36617.1 putative transcriptional regulator, TetR family protein [Nocardia camponoti]